MASYWSTPLPLDEIMDVVYPICFILYYVLKHRHNHLFIYLKHDVWVYTKYAVQSDCPHPLPNVHLRDTFRMSN